MKKSVRLLGLVQVFVFLMSFSSNYAVAQRVTPNMAKKAGTVLSTAILGFVGGAARGAGSAFGSEAASQMIQSGKPYIVFWYVQLQDRRYYRVCQNAQNGRFISQAYWCQ